MEYLILDIGGTKVKCGKVENGTFSVLPQFPINEAGTRTEILSTLNDFVRNNAPDKIIVSIPGPMDYRNGTSFMRHKFAALNGVSLKKVWGTVFPEMNVVFVHDAVAYLLGESAFGVLKGISDAACVILGTGLGFAEMHNGKVYVSYDNIPSRPLWNKPFHNSVTEDYISARGIRRRWHKLSETELDVRDIALLAEAGDVKAKKLFFDTGKLLAEALVSHLDGRKVNRIAVGGQIAKSWALMQPGFDLFSTIPALCTADPENMGVYGAYLYAVYGDSLLYVAE